MTKRHQTIKNEEIIEQKLQKAVDKHTRRWTLEDTDFKFVEGPHLPRDE